MPGPGWLLHKHLLNLTKNFMVSNDPHFTNKQNRKLTCPPWSTNPNGLLSVQSNGPLIHLFKHYNYSNFKPHTQRSQRRNIYGKSCVPVSHGTQNKIKGKGREGRRKEGKKGSRSGGKGRSKGKSGSKTSKAQHPEKA